MQNTNKPNIPSRLLWEFDYDSFDFKKSYKIVIERVLERGNLDNWREMIRFYSKSQILETIEWSSQIDEKDKRFSRLFINSDFVNVV
ncbi:MULTISPECIES: DUF6922 domain-containing protein [Dyadobacter]|uniref:DUF6922 domain-containing protein n=1 Tax=Dyadobacter chenhuakuii TaxID=2909339 RepID=A0A9X1TTT9_9BACT|nr:MULTISPECIES: hypothetical protein [Dyadobacter]MCF2496029.1 hypothetical protein [Dyadobacter chenhuakuii]MCF2499480.1 hypothetical protein [Dyadobacter chenhuakuii]MCF2519980.1 hypothetical protein [Dyadobacter sp. CY351]USJ30096.1 hypothetical protein NFI80_19775 [Dyadobacter chenhuakuii]